MSAAFLPATSNADYMIDLGAIRIGDAQDIVISPKQSPLANAEAVCLSITLARSLQRAGKNVTLFPTLDAVAIGDAKVVSSPRFKCNIGQSEISLKENLEAFLGGNNNHLVICPLCWGERYGTQKPDYGVLDGNAVGAVLLGAEKVIDF